MARYTNIPVINSSDGKQMYQTVRYPEIARTFEDTYVYATAGDRFDTLALQYYGDSTLWWVIANANGNLVQDSLTPPEGSQIRIPANPTPTLSSYKNLNLSTSISSTSTTINGGSTSGGGSSTSGGGY